MASNEKDLAMMVWERAREVFHNRCRHKWREGCILPYLYPFPVTNAMIPFRGPVSLHEKLQQQLHPESIEKFKENENVVMNAAEQEKIKDTEQEHRNSSSNEEMLVGGGVVVEECEHFAGPRAVESFTDTSWNYGRPWHDFITGNGIDDAHFRQRRQGNIFIDSSVLDAHTRWFHCSN